MNKLIDKTEELFNDIIQCYEIDLDNCEMQTEDFARALAKALADPNYLKEFRKIIEAYKKLNNKNNEKNRI